MDQPKTEVLRYLGHRGQELAPELSALVDACMAECREAAKPLHLWQLFDVAVREDVVALAGTPLVLEGGDIRRHLEKAPKAAVMAATLGVGVDHLIRRWEYTDLTRSVILDACATQLIEEVCDQAEEEVEAEAARLGLHSNFRYSPGYGDLPLTVQPNLLAVLGAAKRIGLTCTESHILLPRKSVTALIGLLPPGEAAAPKGGCAACALRDSCKFKKDGGTDGCDRIVAQ